MPRGIDAYDTALRQGRLWTPRELLPTIWLDPYGLTSLTTWKNYGSLSNATITGTAIIPAPNGLFNATPRWKPAININTAAATTLGDITGAATSTCTDLREQVASPTVAIVIGAATHQAVFGAAYPCVGVHVWNWANATLTNNVSRISWLNGTLLPANSGGTTGATSGAGFIAWAGAQVGAGGGNLGRFLSVSGGNTKLFNTTATTRAGRMCWNELITVDRQLTTTEQQKVEGYLAWKWAYQTRLAAGHPYASRPPEIGQ